MNARILKTSLPMLAFTLLLVLSTGCAAKEIRLAEEDNGTSVSLGVGDKLLISLPGNPSTGYSWEVQAVDAAILELVGEPEFASDSTDLLGAGGTLTLSFTARMAGTTTLELGYLRPWETGVAPLETFSIEVTVK